MTMPGEFHAPARPTGTRIPDFFIVGHAKSGTTALYEMLRPHPEIYMPEVKEPWFLATDMRVRFQPKRGGVPPQTLEDYLALFADARPDQRAGEASSSYLWSRTAAENIAALQPDAKIIALLREPASFLYSLHLQLVQNHVEVKKAIDALRQKKISASPACAIETECGRSSRTVTPPSTPCAITAPTEHQPRMRVKRFGSRSCSQMA